MATTQRHLPFGPEELVPFTRELFDRQEQKATRLLWSILETHSPRKSDWSQVFSESSEEANYRTIDRTLAEIEPHQALMRMFDPEVPFVLVDPASLEIERPQAKSTDYVGRLSDGKTLGFWMVVFAQPYRGRAVPFHYGIYSETIIKESSISSRNLSWAELVWQIQGLVAETPLVFDREFSAKRWLDTMEEAELGYVVRLNQASGVKIVDDYGEQFPLLVEKGRKRHIEGAYYRGEVNINVVGVWREGCREPLWVMGNLPTGELISVYEKRMKIEQSFRDAKSLLDLQKVMNKKREKLEKTLALMLLAYSLALMLGEGARDEAYGRRSGGGKKGERASHRHATRRKWDLYSGVFVLLKKRLGLSAKQWRDILRGVLALVKRRLFPPLPSSV